MVDDYRNFVAEVKRNIRIADIVSQRVSLKRSGRDFIGLCPFHNEKTPSFRVNQKDSYYKCFGCGAGGDAINFLMELDGLSFKEAVDQIGGFYGLSDAPALQKKIPPKPKQDSRPAEDIDRNRQRINGARQTLKECQPAKGTFVEEYLKARSIDPERLPPKVFEQLRFHPRLTYYASKGGKTVKMGRFPAMVAPMQNSKGEIVAVHMTYLNGDSAQPGKVRLQDPEDSERSLPAKKMRGLTWGAAIRLGPAQFYMQFSEGIENGLAALMLHPTASVWVAGSLNNLAGAGWGQGDPHPKRTDMRLPSIYPDLTRHGLLPPPQCGSAIIVADNDSKDPLSNEALVKRAEQRFSKMGFFAEVLWPPEGQDLNDVLMGAA